METLLRRRYSLKLITMSRRKMARRLQFTVSFPA